MPRYDEPETNDRMGEKILTALMKKGPCSTTELKSLVGVDDGKKIRHRIDEWFAPVDLVEEYERREHPGYDVRVFRLTRQGHLYVADMWGNLAKYAERDEVLETAHGVKQEVGLVRDRVDEVDERVDGVKREMEEFKADVNGDVGGFHGELEKLKERVGALEAANRAEKDRRSELENRVDSLENSVGDVPEDETLAGQVEEVRKIAEEAWAWTVGDWVSKVRNPEEGKPMSRRKVVNEVKSIFNIGSPNKRRFWER